MLTQLVIYWLLRLYSKYVPSIVISILLTIEQSGVSSGVRRVEAVVGEDAVKFLFSHSRSLRRAATSLSVNLEGVETKIEDIKNETKQLKVRNNYHDFSIPYGQGKLSQLKESLEDGSTKGKHEPVRCMIYRFMQLEQFVSYLTVKFDNVDANLYEFSGDIYEKKDLIKKANSLREKVCPRVTM